MSGAVVVAGWIGSANLGDELVHAGVRRMLATAGAGPVTAVSISPARTRAAFGDGSVRAAAAAPTIARARLLVLGGGGLVQDVTSPWNLPYHLARPALAILTRTPWVGVALGVGPLRTRPGRAAARLLRSAVACSVRDPRSQQLLRALGVTDVVVAADAALTLPVPDVAVEDVVVVSLRPWEAEVTGPRRLLPDDLRRRLDRRDRDRELVRRRAAALDTVATATGMPIRLVALHSGIDAVLHEQVAAAMRTPVRCLTPGVHDVVDEVARGRVVIGMRYHAGVCATLGGRPLVALSYDPKVASLAEALGPGAAALPWDADQLLPAVEQVLGHDDDVAAAREGLVASAWRSRAVLERGLAVGS